MFINTIAVGPLEPAAFWVTGGATVALVRVRCEKGRVKAGEDVAGAAEARLQSCVNGVRKAMTRVRGRGALKRLVYGIIGAYGVGQ